MGLTQSDRADDRRRAAELRLGQLESLRIRLAAGERLTADDLDDASRRLAEARRRAFEAASSAREAHQRAAAAHTSAALVNDDAGRSTQAQAHRQAAERDLEAMREAAE